MAEHTLDTTTLEVSRHEIKFLINAAQYVNLSGALTNTMLADPHNGYDGYPIRSLYFDTYAETDFYQKLSGIENRKKIRLRIYDPGDPFVKLEIKRKYGDNQIKSSVLISPEDAGRLIHCEYETLRHYQHPAADMICHIMKVNHVRPVVLVEYRRRAFIHPTNNIRITLDTNIRSSETCLDLFDPFPVLLPVEEFAFAMVEVKYDAFLMHWLSELLSHYDLVRSAYSKYTASRGLFERQLG